MATMRANPRLQVGSASWITEERASAMQIADSESEEFGFSARNEVDWLNEHMAEIFSKSQVNVADIFKTPGKLRGKTPRTIRKAGALETRAPLSDVFSATPRGGPSPFRQINFEKPVATFQVAEDEPISAGNPSTASVPDVEDPFQQKVVTNAPNLLDSGYYGSQAIDATQPTQPNEPIYPASPETSFSNVVTAQTETVEQVVDEITGAEERRSTEGSFQSAKEEQTGYIADSALLTTTVEQSAHNLRPAASGLVAFPLESLKQHASSVIQLSPKRLASPLVSPVGAQRTVDAHNVGDVQMDDIQSPQTDGSSPIRPIVRKSSLNFASLPAREPLTSKKSIGNRASRTSHLEQPRTSYYGRPTGGKSIGNAQDEDDVEDMGIDELDAPELEDNQTRIHNKTSTQRLQDQISMLGKLQNTRPPAKSITASGLIAPQGNQSSQASLQEDNQSQRAPQHKERPPPGAFPDDEEDSWIGPPNAGIAAVPRSIFSPRPQIPKSHSTDVMEEIHGKDSIGGAQFNIPKRREDPRQNSPLREPIIPDRTTSTLGLVKSVSASVIRSPKKAGDSPESKVISVSNPNPSTNSDEDPSPLKSPSRSYRGSPLKAAKDKFSSILKTSRGLFASSAAVSADAKSNLSPSASRIGLGPSSSMSSLLESQPSYPDLALSKVLSSSSKTSDSPARSIRKTRASTEKEERKKQEEIREAKEIREAQKMNNQLEKARQKVKDEARTYHLEQERFAAMQKEVAARQEQERIAKENHTDQPRATRSSPRKTKAQLEAESLAVSAVANVEDPSSAVIDIGNASQCMPPPAVPRPKSQIGRPTAKRPLKPAKDSQSKARPPTVIRVDTGSQRGHQYHPSNATLSATLQESLPQSSASSQPTQNTIRHKASTSSIQSKASTTSFKSAATKTLEAAARKKEQDELAMQRKREAKQEVERQRAALKEEDRRKEEQQRRQEIERQREIQRERERVAAAADAKKAASRQALERRRLEMEKAKESRAPPPAPRPQSRGDALLEKALPPVPQTKVIRMNPTAPRTQDEFGRPVNTMQNPTKAPAKRPLPQDTEDYHTRPPVQRNPPSYQQNESNTKRRKTSEVFDDEDLTEDHPKMTAPPIRQSSIRPKEMPTKSLFPSGYANAPPVPGNLQRSTLLAQHSMNQTKPVHPMDMTQVSKAPIAFASSSSQSNGQYKTPARPAQAGAKSTAKSSPRYQNGENISLPEIQTDSEDDEEDEGRNGVKPGWAESPAVAVALVKQEGMNPADIFGPPRPLDMEAVFSKSKDRFHKFRARTSSANWSGEDRLTQDEIRKDVEARDKLRRQGYWSYDNMV